jgi:hypothetical protein
VADIFNVSPPAWLQNLTASNDKGLLGGIAGELLGGGLIAANKVATDTAPPDERKNWLQDLPQSIAEAHLNFLDPSWKIKVQQGQLNIAQTGLQLQEMQQKIAANAAEVQNQAQDIQNIPAWQKAHNTPESRLTATDRPPALSAKWQMEMYRQDMADTAQVRAQAQTVQSKVAVLGAKTFSDRLQKLSADDPVGAAQIQSRASEYLGKGQMPPPAVTEALAAAEESTRTRQENARVAAANEALARGETGETRITDKSTGVQQTFKAPDLTKQAAQARDDRVGSEGKTASGLAFVYVGPNQIRLTSPTGTSKDFTPGELLSYAQKFEFAADPTVRSNATEIIKFLGDKAQTQIGGAAPATTAVSAAAPTASSAPNSQTSPAKPTTEAQFNSLPAGTHFINPSDGKLYRKK